MRNSIIKIILLSQLLIISCSCINFPAFKIENYSYNKDCISVTFSSTPNLNTIKNAFYFLEDEIQQDGKFLLNNKTMFFYPVKNISEDHDYTIVITTDAEDTKGISLDSKFSTNFTTRKNTGPLKILRLTQMPNGFEIDFSAAVNKENFQQNLNFSPSTDLLFFWNDDYTNVKIKYQNKLESNTRYFITISKNLCDTHNNNLEQDFLYNFVSDNYKINEYSLFSEKNLTEQFSPDTQILNLSSKEKLIFQFFNESDSNSFPATIKFYPELNYRISQSSTDPKQYSLSYIDQPEYSSIYEMSVEYNSTAIQTDKISHKYYLHFNNVNDEPPQFISGLIKIHDDKIQLSDTYPVLSFSPDIFPTIDTFDSERVDLFLLFSTNSSATDLQINSLINNISITSTNNCIELLPDMISQIKDSEQILKLTNFSTFQQDINYDLVKISCEVKNKPNKGLIQIKIGKEVSDTNENPLGKDYIFWFNKQ